MNKSKLNHCLILHPILNHPKRTTSATLLLLTTILSLTILPPALKPLLSQQQHPKPTHHKTSLLINLALFIASCAPLSFILGILSASLYYLRKHGKYGRYEPAMRRKGKRGYWVDPSDLEDKNRVDEARRVSSVVAVDEKRGDEMELSLSSPQPPPPTYENAVGLAGLEREKENRRSMFNPFGWGEEYGGRTERVEEWVQSVGGVPERAVSREARRVSEKDPVVKKAVANIWLGGMSDRWKSGYDGREVRRRAWDEEVELDVVGTGK